VGGYGSGRRGGTATAESTASYIIDIKSLASAFENGKRLTGSIRFDEARFPVVVAVDLTNEWNCFVELIHPTRDGQDGDRIVRDRVRLTWTAPTYGGRRWRFLCPMTAHRTTKLFLPNGGSHFWSRQAYGLGYRCLGRLRVSRSRRL
jgi:hypothetical protein